MNWLFFAFLSPAITSIVAFVDKYLLEKKVKDYRGMPIYGSIMAFIFGTLLWIGSGFPSLNYRDTILILFSGMLSIWGSALYFRVIVTEEASKVLILIQMIPIFVLILSALFLQEFITLKQLLGFFLILAGTLGITLNRETFSFKLSKPFLLMFFASFCWAASSVVFKFVIDNNSFAKAVSYESWGITLGGVILYVFFPSIRKAFHQTTRTVRKTTLALLFINEGLFVVSKLFAFLAISMGSVSLVSVIGSTSAFFGIFYGWILTIIAPKILKENITKKEILKKIVLALIVFMGIIVIN